MANKKEIIKTVENTVSPEVATYVSVQRTTEPKGLWQLVIVKMIGSEVVGVEYTTPDLKNITLSKINSYFMD